MKGPRFDHTRNAYQSSARQGRRTTGQGGPAAGRPAGGHAHHRGHGQAAGPLPRRRPQRRPHPGATRRGRPRRNRTTGVPRERENRRSRADRCDQPTGHPLSPRPGGHGPHDHSRSSHAQADRPDPPRGGPGLPPPGAGRSARRRGVESLARRRRAGAALRPSGHRQDESGRGGVPGPAHRRRGRRHHGRRLDRRVHAGRQRRIRLPVRSAGHRDDRGPRPADRRCHLDLTEGPGGAVSRDGRAQADPGQGPQGRDHQGRAGLLRGGGPQSRRPRGGFDGGAREPVQRANPDRHGLRPRPGLEDRCPGGPGRATPRPPGRTRRAGLGPPTAGTAQLPEDRGRPRHQRRAREPRRHRSCGGSRRRRRRRHQGCRHQEDRAPHARQAAPRLSRPAAPGSTGSAHRGRSR